MCQKIDYEWLEREYYGLGYRARDKELIRCEACAKWLPDRKFCVQWHVGTFEDSFCYMAKRSSDGKMQSELGIRTKTVKYYDEDENVWKVGEVIVGE